MPGGEEREETCWEERGSIAFSEGKYTAKKLSFFYAKGEKSRKRDCARQEKSVATLEGEGSSRLFLIVQGRKKRETTKMIKGAPRITDKNKEERNMTFPKSPLCRGKKEEKPILGLKGRRGYRLSKEERAVDRFHRGEGRRTDSR